MIFTSSNYISDKFKMITSEYILELSNVFHSGQVEAGTCIQKMIGTVRTGVILKDVSLEVHGGELSAVLGSKGTYLEGRSLTTLTKFGQLLITYLFITLRKEFLYCYRKICIPSTCPGPPQAWTTHLLCLINVVCERPFSLAYSLRTWHTHAQA